MTDKLITDTRHNENDQGTEHQITVDNDYTGSNRLLDKTFSVFSELHIVLKRGS